MISRSTLSGFFNASWGLLLLCTSGCLTPDARPSIRLRIDLREPVAEAARVVVRSPDGSEQRRDVEALPWTQTLAAATAEITWTDTVVVEVQDDGGAVLFARHLQLHLTTDSPPRVYDVWLAPACADGPACPMSDGLTCGECGRCAPVEVARNALRHQSEPVRMAACATSEPELDASVSEGGPDARAMDAGTMEAGTMEAGTMDASAMAGDATQEASGIESDAGAEAGSNFEGGTWDAASDAETAPDAGTAAPHALNLSASEVVATQHCFPVNVERDGGSDALGSFALESNVAGQFFEDAACTVPVTNLEPGAAPWAVQLYFRASDESGPRTRTLTLTARQSGGMGAVDSVDVELRLRAVAVTAQRDTCVLLADSSVQCVGRTMKDRLGRPSPHPFALQPLPREVTQVSVPDATDVQLGDGFGCVHSGTSGAQRCWGQATAAVTAPLAQVTHLSASFQHACAVVDGAAECWGRDLEGTGRLGSGLPTSGVTHVAAGIGHSCAVVGGDVQCWGSNYGGGLRGEAGAEGSATPVSVDLGGATAIEVYAGHGYSCALTDERELLCWGTPIIVDQTCAGACAPTLKATNVDRVAAGYGSACIVQNERVHCWGENQRGVLGIGSDQYASGPTAVQGLPAGGVQGLAVGWNVLSNHQCAIVDGLVYCWGANNDGQLGSSTALLEDPTPSPANLFPGRSLSDLALSHTWDSHHCAVSEGDVLCWGAQVAGIVGFADEAFPDLPLQMASFTEPVVQVAVGERITMVRVLETEGPGSSQGALWVLGNNAGGRLGLGQPTSYTTGTLQRVPLEGDVQDMAAGFAQACAVADGRLYCWGYEGDQPPVSEEPCRLGFCDLDPPQEVLEPRLVFGPAGSGAPYTGTASAVSYGTFAGCAVVDDGLWCWGELGQSDSSPITGAPQLRIAAGGDPVVDVEVGLSYVCALRESGEVWCLRDQLSAARVLPAAGTPSAFDAVSVGNGYACARETGGASLWCWGEDTYDDILWPGQAGGNPVRIELSAPIGAFSVHGDRYPSACAVAADQLECWGSNALRQGGNAAWVSATPRRMGAWE